MMSTPVTCNKSCSYKDCGNSTKNIPTGSDITFFRFPQNPERLFKWKILCGLQADSNPKFICSKHFDHRKYVSCNSRRKTLIQTAVPYAYNQVADDTVNEFQEFELVEIENDNGQYDDKNQQYQAIIHDVPEVDGNDATEIQDNSKIQNIIQLTPIKVHKNATVINTVLNNKRTVEISLNEVQDSAVSPKKLKIDIKNDKNFIDMNIDDISFDAESILKNQIQDAKVSQKKLKIQIDNDKSFNDINIDDISIDAESILKQDEINTFIFKNEEYIQMPKRIFMEHFSILVDQIQSKKLLLAEIDYYKNQLTKIKNIIDV